MTRLLPAALAAALCLSGCGDGGSQSGERAADSPPLPPGVSSLQTRTVLQFLENTATLEETWALCRNDPGGIGQTPDCRNAGHAKERLMMLGRERAIQSLNR